MADEKPASSRKLAASPTTGLAGFYDRLLRSYRGLVHGLTMVPLYFLACLIMGTGFLPGVGLFHLVSKWTAFSPNWVKFWAYGVNIAVGYYAYGLTLVILIPIVNAPVLKFLKPFRSPFHSVQVFPWYVHNSLLYIIRYSFLEFITPTPINLWFFKRMGMKIGKGVQINTSHITDPAMITLEDGVMLGGSATVIAHYGVNGILILAPTILRKNAMIGLRAIIMADVEIGEGAKILPNSVVLPKTRVPAGETWGGVPARKINLSELSQPSTSNNPNSG